MSTAQKAIVVLAATCLLLGSVMLGIGQNIAGMALIIVCAVLGLGGSMSTMTFQNATARIKNGAKQADGAVGALTDKTKKAITQLDQKVVKIANNATARLNAVNKTGRAGGLMQIAKSHAASTAAIAIKKVNQVDKQAQKTIETARTDLDGIMDKFKAEISLNKIDEARKIVDDILRNPLAADSIIHTLTELAKNALDEFVVSSEKLQKVGKHLADLEAKKNQFVKNKASNRVDAIVEESAKKKVEEFQLRATTTAKELLKTQQEALLKIAKAARDSTKQK